MKASTYVPNYERNLGLERGAENFSKEGEEGRRGGKGREGEKIYFTWLTKSTILNNHNITQLLDCISWDYVSDDDGSPWGALMLCSVEFRYATIYWWLLNCNLLNLWKRPSSSYLEMLRCSDMLRCYLLWSWAWVRDIMWIWVNVEWGWGRG